MPTRARTEGSTSRSGGRRQRAACAAAALAAAAVGLTATPAHAAPGPFPKDILVTFEGEPIGAKPNGYTVAGAPAVHFSDTGGSGMQLGQYTEGEGTRSLVLFGNASHALEIRLDRPTTKLSLRFGNDDPAFSQPGDEAVLTLYRATTQVGEVRVTMNRNDVMDQTITAVDGPLFSRAVFRFDTAGVELAEVVDHILVGPLCTIAGSDGNDTLVGTNGPDTICGGPGNDTVRGLGGNDVITGGTGADTISGGDGNDIIRGNFGADTIHGDAGDDRVEGREDNDKLFGDAGSDALDGGPGSDRCDGGTQSDGFSATCEVKVGTPVTEG